MIFKLFTVYDTKAEAYLQPFYSPARGAALRSFMDTCAQRDHAFNKFPQDYSLFELGSFDDATAKFDIYPQPIHVANAIELVEKAV